MRCGEVATLDQGIVICESQEECAEVVAFTFLIMLVLFLILEKGERTYCE